MAQKNSNNKNNPIKPDGKKGGKSPKFPTWSIFVLFFVLLLAQVLFFSPETGNRIKYSEFLNYVEQGYVSEITITNEVEVTGTYSDQAISDGVITRPESSDNNMPFATESSDQFKNFNTTMLRDDDIRPLLESNNVTFDVRVEEDWFSGIFIWLIPIALLIVIWIFIFRKMNPGQQVLNIGKNKASLYDQQTETKVTFEDVAGLQEAKAEVEEVVEFLKNPQKFTRLGGVLPKGVLLVGPPGTGKTLLAKATAGEASVPFFSLSGSDFVEMFVGVGAARVRDLFKQAKEKAPCIIFIDEIDSIGRTRGRGMAMGSNDERENTLNQLLSEMDGFNSDKGVILMAATNRPDILDSALLRPGRFDRQIMIDKPDLNGRVEILKVHSKKLKLGSDIDLRVLASQTPGFAGADLANLCNEAALLAARREKESIEMEDFQDSIEKVIAGLERKNKLISPHERKIVAYHEAGHAIVGWFLEHTDPVLKVSIVPRGLAALGYTLQTPLEERFLMTTEELDDKICALLGGRVAEEIIFGRISTGAQNDLERITKMAFAMVAEYGMSEKLGYISLKDSQSAQDSFGFNRKYSESTSQQIDQEIRQIVDRNHERTIQLLQDHKEDLEKLAKALLEREVLDHHALRELLGDRPHGKYPDGIFEKPSDSNKNGVSKKEAKAEEENSVSNDSENTGEEENSKSDEDPKNKNKENEESEV
ncbi:ATP-dependent zinc metalloprotease FtsH [Gracilimonas sp.]|uniref:ATP-dependent zinc metalloprotease FtsH n=1 Tax=Gracilimonas sp. TaxID=1974203 RepID=UPI00287221A8|nr:ATP-dependent zinc metalloprotease FtsH [Gracilimonas sp.]